MRARSASSSTASPALTVNVVLIVPQGKDAHEVLVPVVSAVGKVKLVLTAPAGASNEERRT